MRALLHPSSFGALRSLATLTAIVTPTVAFTANYPRWETHGVGRRDSRSLRPSAFQSQVRMMAAGPKVPIQITGNNIEVRSKLCLYDSRKLFPYFLFQVTPAIRDYVNDKIGSALSKVGRRVTKCDVHIIFDKNPSDPTPASAEVDESTCAMFVDLFKSDIRRLHFLLKGQRFELQRKLMICTLPSTRFQTL